MLNPMVDPMKFTIVKPLLNHKKSPGEIPIDSGSITIFLWFSHGFVGFLGGFGLLQALRCLANDAGAHAHVEAPLPEAGEDLMYVRQRCSHKVP